MIPQFDTEKAGRCVSCCLGSILELDVPSFGLGDKQIERVQRWLNSRGWFLLEVVATEECREEIVGRWSGYHVMSGPSPRYPNLKHMVVGLRGEMVHDPFPDGEGLGEVEHYGFLVPLFTKELGC